MLMKALLVPVDFSDNALRSLEFAIAVARKSYTKVLVCHFYELSSVLPGLTEALRRECRKAALLDMKRFLEKVDSSNVVLETIVSEGDTVEEIGNIVEEEDVTLIVMGTGGGSSFVKRLFGTTAQKVAKKGMCPVLVIPDTTAIRPIESIVYAADFENGDEVTAMQLLKVTALFNASLTFLHVKSERQPDYIDDAAIKENLIRHFPYQPFSFVEIKSRHIAEGISCYVQAHNTSLLAFTILNKPLWEKVEYGSVTKKLLQQLKTPMLALPENGVLLELQYQHAYETDSVS